MNFEGKTITSTGILELCQIKYERLAKWLKEDLFQMNELPPGAGYARQFSFDDTVIAMTVVEIMRMMENLKIARQAVTLLRKDPIRGRVSTLLIEGLGQIDDNGGFVTTHRLCWGSVTFSQINVTDIVFIDSDSEKERKSLVIIPVPSLMNKAKTYFENLPEKKQVAEVLSK